MPTSPRRLWMVLPFAAAALGVVLWHNFGQRESSRSDTRLQTAFYVWQEIWSEDVLTAIKNASNQADRWMVLAGEFRAEDGRLIAEPRAPNWTALAQSKVPLTLVIRLQPSIVPLTQSRHSKATASFIHKTIFQWITPIDQHGILIDDVQLDFDCPTAKLNDYSRLLRDLLDHQPPWKYSITALPDWSNSEAFPNLVDSLPYYVLQVHSLDKPQSIRDDWTLFDTQKTQIYLQQASRIKTPFYLALPTYGYELLFDESGKFTALQADGSTETWIPGGISRTVIADPFQIASFIREYRTRHPPQCRGITWFRLPVGSERLNWPWTTLEAILAGRDPKQLITAEIRSPEPYLFEVWIVNTGEWNPNALVRVPIEWDQHAMIAYDIINQFQGDKSRSALVGPSPRIEEPLLAAWYRVAPTISNTTETLQVGEVEVLP